MLTAGWSEGICHEARNFHDVDHGDWGSVALFMLQSLVPARADDKTRFQVAIEVDGSSGEWIEPLALRACSGQQNIQQLDATRFAAIATPQLLAKLPGLFHITPLTNLAKIVSYGLKPGWMLDRKGRKDIHFSPFPPHDRRNEMMRHKINKISRGQDTYAVISVNPMKCPKNSLRFCLANNIVLCTEVIGTHAFDGIWTLGWSDRVESHQQWIYEPMMEDIAVTHFQGDKSYPDTRLASLIAEGTEAYNIILAECQESSPKQIAHYHRAVNTPITAKEQSDHEGIPMRRCPACLQGTASRMAHCLCCSAEFMGQFRGGGKSRRQPDIPALFRVPPKSTASRRASSAPATVRQRPQVKLTLPTIVGLPWKTALYPSGGVDYEYIVSQRRMRQPVDDKG